MDDRLIVLIGIMIPFIGTTVGASFVFFLKKEMGDNLQKALLGFASGVMIAASVWSLLIPAINMAEEQGQVGWMPAAVGFLLGIFFLLGLDTFIPHLHTNSDEPEGPKSSLGKSAMLMLAVTLHNFPEGMAVGVVFVGLLTGQMGISLTGALALSLGIALQNIPEGAIISMPLTSRGIRRGRAFAYGTLSGLAEPLGALITIALSSLIIPALPFILAFAAGAMIYVVVEELIPQCQLGEHSNIGTIGVALGFTLMMILDVALG